MHIVTNNVHCTLTSTVEVYRRGHELCDGTHVRVAAHERCTTQQFNEVVSGDASSFPQVWNAARCPVIECATWHRQSSGVHSVPYAFTVHYVLW